MSRREPTEDTGFREGRMRGDRRGGHSAGAGRVGLAILITGLTVGGTAWGQGAAEPEAIRPTLAGMLRIRSEPSGALVTLEGEHVWKGSTPWELSRGLRGDYEVTADLAGYERWRRRIHLIEGETRDLDIRLSRKTAIKGALRSAIVPGWGQFYAGRSAKGTVFLAGTAAAAGGLLWTHEIYQDDLDELRDLRQEYQNARTVEEIERLRPLVEAKRHDADRSFDRRQLMLFITGGIYAASLLDALLLFPGPGEGSFASVAPWGEEGPEFSLQPTVEGGMALRFDWTGGEDRIR